MELLDLQAVERVCRRAHGRRGLSPLERVLCDFQPVPEANSELERQLVALCRESGLPRPSVNRMVEGLEVDALWSNERLVVELDGYAFHKGRAAFERDRAR